MKQVYAKVTDMGIAFDEKIGRQTVRATIRGGVDTKFGVNLHITIPYKEGMDLMPLTKGTDYVVEIRRVHEEQSPSKLGL